MKINQKEIKPIKLQKIYDAQKQVISLNTYVNDDNDTEMGDLIPSDEVLVEETVTEMFRSQDIMDLLLLRRRIMMAQFSGGEHDYSKDYLTFRIISGGTFTIYNYLQEI